MPPAKLLKKKAARRIPPDAAGPGMTTVYVSPIGPIEIRSSGTGIVSLTFIEGKAAAGRAQAPPDVPAVLKRCVRELEEYFGGRRRTFGLKLDLRGTEFQKRVWQELTGIPFGWTVSYADIARALGGEGAARAVGGANHANPVPIIIPCHRVVGRGGRLTGYGGGLWRKSWLLEHERQRT